MKSPLLLLLHYLCNFVFLSARNNDNNNSRYNSFAKCLANISRMDISKIVHTPNNPTFTKVLQSYIRNRRFNRSTTHKPHIIITPTAELHVSATVICAKSLNIQIKIRSGGHDYEGTSYVSASDFAILDMFNFRSVNVSIDQETAWVGSGAYLGELYYGIFEKSNVHGFPGGVCPTVGIGGIISGGGYGVMLRKHGLAADHVVDAKMVDSNGAVLDGASMGRDLFWAIRGGGGASFGVILAYKVTLVRVPEKVTVFRLEKLMAEKASQVVYEYQQAVQKMEKELFVRVLLQPVTVNAKVTIRATFIGMFLGNANQLLGITNSVFSKLGLRKPDCQEMPWVNAVLFWAEFDKSALPRVLLNRTPQSISFLKRKSDYVKQPIPILGLEKIFRKMIELGEVWMYFNSYGGIMNEIPEDQTPFPHRAGNLFKIQYLVNWDQEGKEAEKIYIDKIRALYNFMEPYVSKDPREAYLDYRDLDIGTTDNGKKSYEQGKVYGIKYFKQNNFDRLVRIKTQVDPHNFFRNEQSIPTSFKN